MADLEPLPTEFPTEVCRYCHRPVVWATTIKGRLMPVDPEPDDRGNCELRWERSDISGRPFKRVLVHGQPPLDAPPLHMSHMATCANPPP